MGKSLAPGTPLDGEHAPKPSGGVDSRVIARELSEKQCARPSHASCQREPIDEAQMATWLKQAAALPGWIP